MAKIARLAQHYFAEPRALPHACVVPVKTREPAERFGGHLPCVSPIEWRMAVLEAVARDIKAKDEGKMQAWRRHLLSCRFEYTFCDDEESIFTAARQIREDIAQDYAALQLSPLQKVYELLALRDRLAPRGASMSSDSLANEFCKGLRGGQVGGDFVDMAVTVGNYLLCNNRIAATLLLAEDRASSPFDSAMMMAIVRRAQTAERMAWVAECVFDICCHNAQHARRAWTSSTSSGT